MLDYENDAFRQRCKQQTLKGVHRHWLAKRANMEYLEIGLLVMTEPIEQNHYWWTGRAVRLCQDKDINFCDMTQHERLADRVN